MLIEEILIDGVFVAALLTVVACVIYLAYLTILERHLLRTRRGPARAATTRPARHSAASPASVPLSATPDGWHRGPGSPALPEGRG